MHYIEPLLALFLLGASAFFSAAETALVTLSAQKTKHLAIQNPKLSNHLIGWLARPHELIIVLLTGNTIAVVMFAALLTSFALKTFPNVPPHYIEATGWFFQTTLMLIIGEMAPKFLGRIYPEEITLFSLPWLARVRRLCAPLVKIATRIIAYVVPSWMSKPIDSYVTLSIDELRLLLEEAQPGTAPQKESLTMMQRAIDITHKTAAEIMTKIENIDYVDLDAPIDRDDLIDLMIENGHTRTPVRKNKDFVGYIHTHDLLSLIIEDQGRDLAYLVLAAHTIGPAMKVSEILQTFKTSSVHIGFVRDKENAVVGMVTLEDVMEEITGEILDEYDVAHRDLNA
jgi:CBS domain containing-hemolysin-like protein